MISLPLPTSIQIKKAFIIAEKINPEYNSENNLRDLYYGGCDKAQADVTAAAMMVMILDDDGKGDIQEVLKKIISEMEE